MFYVVVFYVLPISLMVTMVLAACVFLRQNKSIYIIYPCDIPEQNIQRIENYAKDLEEIGYVVNYLYRYSKKGDLTDVETALVKKKAISGCGRVDVFWDANSKGSHIDLGMAIAFDKPIVLVDYAHSDDESGYLKTIRGLKQKMGY